MEYGYARVSAKDQNLDRQILSLMDAGVSNNNIFIEKVSGKNFERKQYKKLLNQIQKGDVIFIKSIDRLGRDYLEIMDQWRLINRVKEVDIVVLDFDLLDTRQYISGLTGQFITHLVLQILSYVAQIERENILIRQSEGIACAKRKGVKFGRPKKPMPENFEEIYRDWRNCRISMREASRRLSTNPTLFSRWVNDFEESLATEHE